MAAQSPEESARAIAMRMIAVIGEEIVEPSGYDKEQWLTLVARRMKADEPVADAVIKTASATAVYRSLIEQYIRSSKNAAIENLTDLERIKARLRQEHQIVQVKGADGAYVAKPLKACSALELDTLAEQYERSAASDTRRARFCRLLARQMRLAGLADSDPLSKLIA